MNAKCELGFHEYERIHKSLNNTRGLIQYRKCKNCGKEQLSSDKKHKYWKDINNN